MISSKHDRNTRFNEAVRNTYKVSGLNIRPASAREQKIIGGLLQSDEHSR
jgi:hypothetical protein